MSIFKAGRYSLQLDGTIYIMGILNVTPDSFSDGGKFFQPHAAVNHALQIQEQGADILDVGAQSTRPGFTRISEQEEWDRLEPVLRALQGKLKIPVSVDTFYPSVAEKALKTGVDIINDVTGFQDPGMFQVAAKTGCGCVMMHNGAVEAENESEDILLRVKRFFLRKIEESARFGIPVERICLDPGVGFGKTYEQNLSLLANVEQIKIPGVAFLMAASRKRVIGQPCGNPLFQERLPGTLAAHTIAAAGGADILRVHDVAESVQAARVTKAVLSMRDRRRTDG